MRIDVNIIKWYSKGTARKPSRYRWHKKTKNLLSPWGLLFSQNYYYTQLRLFELLGSVCNLEYEISIFVIIGINPGKIFIKILI